MNSLEIYNKVFCEQFGINEGDLQILEYQGIPEWDSVGHMTLIAELEEKFDIMMDTEDIIDFSSYMIGKKILEKYNVFIK